MEPTIRSGQIVSVTEVDAGSYRPKRGDIVVFTAPAGWLATGGSPLVKRVVGLPGERLAYCDPQGRWTVDGTPLDEPYVKPGTKPSDESMDVTVPDGRLWVMGDNRSASHDSRTHHLQTSDMQDATIPVDAVSAIVQP